MCNDNYNMDNPSLTHGLSFDCPKNNEYNMGQPLIIPWLNFGLRLNHVYYPMNIKCSIN